MRMLFYTCAVLSDKDIIGYKGATDSSFSAVHYS